jgi:magnesium transporter
MSPVERAERFIQLRDPDRKAILSAAPAELSASILSDCDSASLAPTLSTIDRGSLAPAFRLIAPDNLADIVLRLPAQASREILQAVDPALREEVEKLMLFDPDSAGGLMTPRYLSVPDLVNAARAVEILRSARRADSPSYVYVVDASGRLVGVAPLRALLLAGPRDPIRSLMITPVVSISQDSRKEEIVNLFNQHHYVSLPVVDDKDRLVGIVTADDVRRAMRSEEVQVIQGVTGIDPRERLKETFAVTRGRIPWISVTILAGLGCAAIGGLFERTLERLVVLGIFVPLVLALGESIAAQTTSVVLSAQVGGGLTAQERVRFLWKEFWVGVWVGIYGGIVVGLTSLVWHRSLRLGLAIGLSVFVSIAWAALLAILVPGFMRRLHLNPSISTGPLVLAMADVSTLLFYFGAATLLAGRAA